VDKRLSQHIIDGERIGLEVVLNEALTGYPAVAIINTSCLIGHESGG